jgi:hypothetical protein
MRVHRILFVCAAIAIPQLSTAKLPFSNDAFGKVEGIMNYCAKVNPESAAKFQGAAKAFVKDVPEKEVAEARKTAEYKDSYDGISEELNKAPIDTAAQTCKAALESKK